MRGTLRRGDVLWLEAAAPVAIRPGDVIAFRGEDGRCLVHRVLACTPAGWRTRGDHNPRPDEAAVRPEALIGRVRSVERRGRVRVLLGGPLGLLWAGLLRLGWPLARALGGPYRALRASGWVRQVWRPALTQVAVQGAQGLEYKLLHRGRAVAAWSSEGAPLWYRKPYDLLLATLPSPPPQNAGDAGADAR